MKSLESAIQIISQHQNSARKEDVDLSKKSLFHNQSLERLGSQDAPNTDMFDLCEGSVLTILSDCGDGLLLVRTDSGKTGYVQNAVCFW